MSFSQQSKFNLLRDQRKVANREAHGAQDGSDQPVGRPDFLPPTSYAGQTPHVQTSRAPSTIGDDMDVQSIGFVSVASNKTREDGGTIAWDENVASFTDGPNRNKTLRLIIRGKRNFLHY